MTTAEGAMSAGAGKRAETCSERVTDWRRKMSAARIDERAADGFLFHFNYRNAR